MDKTDTEFEFSFYEINQTQNHDFELYQHNQIGKMWMVAIVREDIGVHAMVFGFAVTTKKETAYLIADLLNHNQELTSKKKLWLTNGCGISTETIESILELTSKYHQSADKRDFHAEVFPFSSSEIVKE